ncbi:hypothetical protein BDA99DRAFT_500675 [Phascolomyces articulosus]|uniref:AMP-dependent synthetase/ligase domain-containing protein n=1 Tax=Phascolomyces articulosus TaxID=60185 RepID=A0AAD5PHC2_9FUNG|nr:hypothetical protein BDA99DRAFT_500675 [Phascolomyces articulosus]
MVLEDLPNYTDYESIIQLFEISVKQHKERPFIHYQQRLSNSLKYNTLTYGEVDRITTYLANEWGPVLLPTTTVTANDNHPTQCIASLGHESSIQSVLIFFTVLKLGLPYYPIARWSTEPVTRHLLQLGNPSYVIATESYFKTQLGSSTTITVGDNLILPVKSWKEYDIDHLIKITTTEKQLAKTHFVPSPSPDDIVIVAVTGGTTTGFPKATIRNHRSFLYHLIEISLKNQDLGIDDALQQPLSTVINKSITEEVHVITAPLDRSSSIYQFLFSMLLGSSVLLFRHDPPSSWDEILAASKRFKPSWIFAAPFQIDKLADYLEQKTESAQTAATVLKGLKGLSTGGAPLRLSTERKLKAQGVIIKFVYAASEFNRLGTNVLDNVLGANRFIFPDVAMPYLLFEPFDQDMYQLVVKNNYPGLATKVGNRPNGDFATSDLFVAHGQHRSHPIWTLVGRTNDVFTIENGKRICPTRMESEVLYEDIIQNCMLLGENKRCCALLVELAADKAIKYSPTDMMNKVYEAVRRANEHVPSYYAVSVPNMVYVLPLNKRLPLTMKSTVFRIKVKSEFYQEIEQLYN